MLREIGIPRTCIRCSGIGVWTEAASSANPVEVHDPCLACNGTGYQDQYKMVLPTGYVWATDVLNCIVLSEYTALTADKKDTVKIILSIGVCNINDGTIERTLLLSAFAAGSQTRTNLQELL